MKIYLKRNFSSDLDYDDLVIKMFVGRKLKLKNTDAFFLQISHTNLRFRLMKILKIFSDIHRIFSFHFIESCSLMGDPKIKKQTFLEKSRKKENSVPKM